MYIIGETTDGSWPSRYLRETAMQLPFDIEISEQISESSRSSIFRGKSGKEQETVILKVLKGDPPAPGKLAGFQREYEIIRSFHSNQIIQAFSLHPYGNTLAMVLEDFKGLPLTHIRNIYPYSLEKYLAIAIKIADALDDIHQKKIIHRNLNLTNILFNPDSGQLKIIDFSMASGGAASLDAGSFFAEVSPPSLSPEQAGRIHAAPDRRSDLYSLGICIYELLTGVSPFQDSDSSTMSHLQCTRVPSPPDSVNPDIPPILSKIILKLLEKSAAGRYQSCSGLRNDLFQCLNDCKVLGKTSEFLLGLHEVSSIFRIPETLFGRFPEQEALHQVCDAVSAGAAEFVLLRGRAGIGKTALAQALGKYAEVKKGCFLSGPCAQFQSGIPYLPIIRALKELVRQILTENDAAIQRWKREILTAIDPNGRILIDFIPEIKGIIGEQPPVPELPPEQTFNRFRLVFRSFLKACTVCRSPIILFLDNVEWADPDSIRLIADLPADSSLHGLLLVCSEDEGGMCPRQAESMLDVWDNSGKKSHCISLAPLTRDDISRLLSETLFCKPEQSAALAQVCLEKTLGIPLCIREFLCALHRDGLLFFDTIRMIWQWKMEAIEKREVLNDPLGLYSAKMRNLPEASQRILKMMAFQDGSADLPADYESAEDVQKRLQQLADQGLLVQSEQALVPAGAYGFVHELARQAAFSLIAEDELAALHHASARRLEQSAGSQDGSGRLFEIAGHLNAGGTGMLGPGEKTDLARKNLLAGRRAMALAAFRQAAVYFETGLRLLPNGSWQQHDDLTLSLHLECIGAECHGLERTLGLVDAIVVNSASTLDKARACLSMLRLLKSRNRLAEALQTGLNGLARLGVRLPANPRKIHIRLSRRKMQLLLANTRVDELLRLPAMTDSTQKLIMELISEIGLIARVSAPGLLSLLTSRALAISLKHGNSLHSAGACYAPCGVLQCSLPHGHIGRGNAFGMLALDLEKQREGRARPGTLTVVNTLITHWNNHVTNSIPVLRTACRDALNEGDFEVAADALLACASHLYWTGGSLPDIREEMEKNGELLQGLGQEIPLHRHRLYQQAVENLLGKNEKPDRFAGAFYDELSMLSLHARSGDGGSVFLLHLLKMAHSYLFDDLEQAWESLAIAQAHLPLDDASILSPLFNFYGSLIELALYDTAQASEQRAIRKKVTASQRKMRQWADWAPMNHEHRYWLVEAEMARVQGRDPLKFYDRALKQARESRYLQEEGLAYEAVSRYHLGMGRDQIALLYIQEARSRYERWGAWAKVRQLDATMPAGSATRGGSAGVASSSPSPVGTAPLIDVEALIDASRRLVDEIVLEELLLKMTGIMIETADAQQGLLLMKEGAGWSVRVKGTMGGKQVLETHTPASPRDIPLSIVEAVSQTGKTVVLHDPGETGPFAGDVYLVRHKPKSVLCTPIVYQDEILCMVYLENNLTSSAFPPSCQELIRLLGSLAALSLRNSNLYEQFSSTVEQLHKEIDKRQAAQLQLLHAEKLSALGRLSASIAHEFGNPLIGVRYLIEDIKNRPTLSKEDRDLLEIGLEECDRMKHLINDLQQINKPSSGKHERFNIHNTIDNVLLFQKKNLKNKKIAIVKAYDLSLPEIVAVEDQITQVLINLTINAVDAMPAEGGCITVSTSGNAEKVFISIKDTGSGIRPEDLDHLFEPFFSTKPAAEGTGLGLPVSYGIIARHGGTITCSSKPGQGTTFTVSLPVSPAQTPAAANQ